MNKIISIILTILFVMALPVSAQKDKKHADVAYWDVVSKRAEKIVTKLNIEDSLKFYRVRDLIAQQYYNLNEIHEKSKAEQLKIKDTAGDVVKKTEKLRDAQTKVDKKIEILHDDYLTKLAKELNSEQIEEVKNGMTYGVVPNTYAGYLEMIPQLTQEEKTQIHDWLVEAREKAMDAGSSDEKHGWFGKYKGRINNYLSGRGYDLKKLSEAWETKLRESGKKL